MQSGGELKDRKIRANMISPGPVDTPIIDAHFLTKETAHGAREWFSPSFRSAALATEGNRRAGYGPVVRAANARVERNTPQGFGEPLGDQPCRN
jgi:NAD(P)-dependent dehydrogenase (short-subunit alcohol dehydrogenase family)